MAARFWVGGTGNWDGVDTTHWSASSGGASGASAPGASDDVTFDGSSGGGTVTVTAMQNILSLTMSAFTGTLDTNDQTMTIGSFTSTGSATRTLDLGASAINITGTGTPWNMSGATNMTLTAGTSTITVSGSSSNFNSGGSGFTYYSVVMNGASTQVLASGTGLVCTNFTRTGTATKTNGLQSSGNLTVSGTLTLNGDSSVNRLLITSNTLGTARTITAAAVSISNADFRDITGAGAASWDLSAITGGSGNCGGNSMKSLGDAAFTTAADQHWISASGGNWSDVTKWTSRVPLPQDNVYFDNAFSASQTVTADMPRLGKSIDWTGASGSPTWSLSSTGNTNYGSVTLISSMTLTSTQAYTFEGRGSFTLTSSGKQFCSNLSTTTVQMVGGTLTQLDSASFGGNLVLTNGTYNTGSFSLTLSQALADGGTSTRSYILGSSIVTSTRTSTGNVLTLSSSGMTFNAGTSTIVISDTGANAKTFAGGGLTYNDLKIAGGGAGAIIITGANTFNRIYTDGGGTKTLTFPASATTTLSYTGTDNFNNGTNVITIASSSGGSAFTISKPIGRFEGNYLNITDSTASGTFYAGENSVNVSGNSGWIFSSFTPNQSGNLMAWLDALDGSDGTFTDRLTKTAYTATSVTRGANVNDGTEMIFNGTSSKIQMGNIGEIYSVTFWVKPGTNACSLIDFNGTEYISTVSGTVTATSWTSPTIYVNGVVTSVLPTNVWSHVAVTSTTSVTASAVVLGLIGSTYGDCSITNVKLYDKVLSAVEVGKQVPSFPSANRKLLQSLVDYTGLTFYKNYGLPNINSVNADYASGSATGTWTVTRGTSTPATYCDSDGTIQLVTGTNPRFTQGFYDSTGFVSRPGLIVEGASTNMLQDSYFADGTTTYWRQQAGTETVATSTDYSNPYSVGTQIMKLTASLVDQGVITAAAKKPTLVSGTTYTVSAMLRGSGDVYLTFRDYGGTVGLSSKITLTNSWRRYQFSAAADANGSANVGVTLKEAQAVSCYVGPIQLEALPFASTFIPTTTAALTRNAETLTYPISGNRTAATESLFVKFTPEWTSSASITINYRLSGTDTKVRDFYIASGGGKLSIYPNITDSGTSKSLATTNTSAFTSYVGAGICYGTGVNPNSEIYINGVSEGSDNTDYVSPAWGTNFYVGCSPTADRQLFGIISSIAIFSDAKSAANVSSITTLLQGL